MLWAIVGVAGFFILINILNSSGYTETCNHCGKHNRITDTQCYNCKRNIPRKCPKCKNHLEARFKKCPYC